MTVGLFLGAICLAPNALATGFPCNTPNPSSTEAFLYTGLNGTGSCSKISQWVKYPTPGDFGLPNDSIRSVKVGSNVRLRIYVDAGYFGSRTDIWTTNGSAVGMPGGFDRNVSSIRALDSARSTTCNDLRPGEFALFADNQYGGDCVVLGYQSYTGNPNGEIGYPNAGVIGLANDTPSSINGGPQVTIPPGNYCPLGGTFYVRLWRDDNYVGTSAMVPSGTSVPALSASSYWFDNRTSSITTVVLCNVG